MFYRADNVYHIHIKYYIFGRGQKKSKKQQLLSYALIICQKPMAMENQTSTLCDTSRGYEATKLCAYSQYTQNGKEKRKNPPQHILSLYTNTQWPTPITSQNKSVNVGVQERDVGRSPPRAASNAELTSASRTRSIDKTARTHTHTHHTNNNNKLVDIRLFVKTLCIV